MVHRRHAGRRSGLFALVGVICLIILIPRPALAAAPRPTDDAYSTPAGVSLSVPAPGVLSNDTDPDGDTLTAEMPSDPAYGTLLLSSTGAFSYTPNAGFSGLDGFTYMVHDTTGGMATASVTITVGSGGSQPTLAVNDVSVTEGSAGTTRTAMFTITRSGSTTAASSVSYSTGSSGTATAGSDYSAVPATVVTLPAGATTKTVTITVLGDDGDESNETFSVNLSAPTGATITDATGIGTIVDDDGPAPTSSFTINNVRVTEGNAGTSTNAVFTITRSNSTGSASVKVVTTGGTAVKGSDYTALPATVVTFAPGEIAKPVPVSVLGDNLDEPKETFFAKLSAPTGATIADAKGVATILDND